MKSEAVKTTQPADWWAAFRKQAQKEGQSLSQWIGECCLANLESELRDGLSERLPAHRPKLTKTG